MSNPKDEKLFTLYPKGSFPAELQDLINRHSIEGGSNTPDFILAEYLKMCLEAFDSCVRRREEWVGTIAQQPDLLVSRINEIEPDKQNNKAITHLRFSEFWNLYNKKVDKAKVKKKFSKLKESEITKIFEVLPRYLKDTPEMQYRKNPLTWLNGRCWEDDKYQPQGDALNAAIEVFACETKTKKDFPDF